MYKSLIRLSLASSAAAFLILVAGGSSVIAEQTKIEEDKLNLRELPYGLTHWPINKMLTVISPLIDAPVGTVYITRTGFKKSDSNLVSLTKGVVLLPFQLVGGIFNGLFGGRDDQEDPNGNRGRIVANVWSQNQGNCTLHTILQKAFYSRPSDSEASEFLNVRSLQIGAGTKIVSLRANGPPEVFTRDTFTYTKCGKNQSSNCPTYTGNTFSLRRDWALQQDALKSLSQMPSGNFKVRYIFDTHTQIDELPGGENVAKVYASCI